MQRRHPAVARRTRSTKPANGHMSGPAWASGLAKTSDQSWRMETMVHPLARPTSTMSSPWSKEAATLLVEEVDQGGFRSSVCPTRQLVTRWHFVNVVRLMVDRRVVEIDPRGVVAGVGAGVFGIQVFTEITPEFWLDTACRCPKSAKVVRR